MGGGRRGLDCKWDRPRREGGGGHLEGPEEEREKENGERRE